MNNNKQLEGLSDHQIQLLALKGLEAREDEKKYSLWHIAKDMKEELNDMRDEILENAHPEELVTEVVESNISVYTYDQVMIYANNINDLDIDHAFAEDFQGAVYYSIYEYLCAEANNWLCEQQEEVA